MKALIIQLFLIQYAFCTSYQYVLAQEWPGTICKAHSCQQSELRNYIGGSFSLHGLWPNQRNAYSCSRIEQCTYEAYDEKQLSSSTLEQMDKIWVGFYSSTQWFRNHEWSKHGTCWNGKSSFLQSSGQNDYFVRVLQLHKQYDLYNSFLEMGVQPSDSTSYPLSQIKGAVKRTLSKGSGDAFIDDNTFQLICNNGMIEQIYLCLDDFYLPMDCNCGSNQIKDESSNSSCGSQVKFPIFRQ